jgi:hypothetical protein
MCKNNDHSIFKNIQDMWGDILPVKVLVLSKTEPASCLSCKIDIFWVVPFLH